MNIELVARDVVITAEVQGRVEQKLEKVLESTNKETPVRLLVENSHGRFVAQIKLHVRGKEIVAQAEEKNMVTAIDDVIEKAERQFRKRQERLTKR